MSANVRRSRAQHTGCRAPGRPTCGRGLHGSIPSTAIAPTVQLGVIAVARPTAITPRETLGAIAVGPGSVAAWTPLATQVTSTARVSCPRARHRPGRDNAWRATQAELARLAVGGLPANGLAESGEIGLALLGEGGHRLQVLRGAEQALERCAGSLGLGNHLDASRQQCVGPDVIRAHHEAALLV